MMGALEKYRNRRILMLQGPLGPFFARLATDLQQVGARLFKVNFNGGDWICSIRGPWEGVSNFTGSPAAWPEHFLQLIERHCIDTVLLFGDCRPIHVPVLVIARRRGLEIGVFEEGYLRPDCITLEQGGVNNRSPLPKKPDFYRTQVAATGSSLRPLGSTFRHAAAWASLYYIAATLGKPYFRNYRHHRPLGVREGFYWIRSYWRKLMYQRIEKHLDPLLLGPQHAKFFLVPLQTRNDAQIRVHSRFRTIERFIGLVIRSFARSAPVDCHLVIKHHPLDRGYSDYVELIDELARRHGIEARCHYIHDQHLPTLLSNTLGVVVINSTVGLSAVGESVPVKVCGEALYDMPGLTFQGKLDDFWTSAASFRPDMGLWASFRSYLLATNQYNGSFYRRLDGTGNRTGVVWSLAGNVAEPHAVPIGADVPRQIWSDRLPLRNLAAARRSATVDQAISLSERSEKQVDGSIDELAAAP